MPILLVRHGETPSNAARVVQLPDAPLSERGLVQAGLLAERLAELGVAAIVASDYARALSTAERVRAATGAPLELWPELRERHFGELRGRSYAEIGHDIFAADYAPPGGETWPDFDARVARAWQRVSERAARTRGNLAVISHGLVCRSVVANLVPRAAERGGSRALGQHLDHRVRLGAAARDRAAELHRAPRPARTLGKRGFGSGLSRSFRPETRSSRRLSRASSAELRDRRKPEESA